MSRLDDEPAVTKLANQLGLVTSTRPADSIVSFCQSRVDRWVDEVDEVRNVGELETLVAGRLQMVFEEVYTDADFDRLKTEYALLQGEFIFASLSMRFDEGTFGMLIERKRVPAEAPGRYVAVIDCRGPKAARRFFTRWHEIAHRLTSHADIPEPVYRSEHDPIERLMDEIAGHVGFYEPIFHPAFKRTSDGKPHLTFGTVETIIETAFPTASFQAALFACVRRLPTPVIYLEAALAYKKEVKRRLEAPSLFGDEPEPGELRAVKVIPNKPAQLVRFTIPTNMRVPVDSVIYRRFEADTQTESAVQENLGTWQSKGNPLQRRVVFVEARKVSDRVIAIVQPVEAVIPTKRTESKSMYLE